jgi:acyl-CoA synthetase (AMP-forming)/AMP-acid ligase II
MSQGLQLALDAQITPELLEFFDACWVLVLEVYGLTETCAATTINTVDALHCGTVGKPLPGVQVATGDDGEVLIRGSHVFKGYFRDPAATHEALTADGWLRTGDLGELSADGFLSITGRKKDLIITSSGKNIAPVNVESELRESRYITEAVVSGDNRPYLVAMLTFDRDESVKLAERFGFAADPVTIATAPRVHGELQKEVDRVNRKVRADRASQTVRDPRPRPHPGRRRADAHPEGQTRDRLREVCRRVRRALPRTTQLEPGCLRGSCMNGSSAVRSCRSCWRALCARLHPGTGERLRAFPYPISMFLTTPPVRCGGTFGVHDVAPASRLISRRCGRRATADHGRAGG